jgi:hypothetical protein
MYGGENFFLLASVSTAREIEMNAILSTTIRANYQIRSNLMLNQRVSPRPVASRAK